MIVPVNRYLNIFFPIFKTPIATGGRNITERITPGKVDISSGIRIAQLTTSVMGSISWASSGRKEAKKIKWSKKPDIAKERADLLQNLDGLYYSENPAQGIFRGQKFFHPDFNFTITFPDNWKTTNTPSLVGAFMENQEA